MIDLSAKFVVCRLPQHVRRSWMLWGVMILVGVTPGVFSQPATSQRAPGPAFVPVDPVHDFGKVVEGQKLAHRFTFKNVGTMPLEIVRVAPACGCMTAPEFTKSVGIGETGGVAVTLDTARLLGPFMKTVNVVTNDPANEIYTFTLRGEGRRLVEVSPMVAGFGRIVDDRTREVILTITNRWEKPMTILLVDPKTPGSFQFELIETSPGYEYKLCVVLRPPFKEGTIHGIAGLTTNVPGQEKMTINATAIVLPRLETLPNSLYYGDASGAATVRGSDRMVEFFNHGSKPVALKEVKVDDSAVTIVRKDVEPGFLYRLQVRTPNGYKPPSDGKMITLTTDDPDRPTLQVPIRLTGATRASGPPPTTKPATTQKAEQKPVMELVGKAAPQIALLTGAGLPVTNSEFSRYPATVLNFVAPNCGFCKKQIPWVEKVRADYQERGVRFVNVGEALPGKAFTLAETSAVMDQLGSRLELAMDSGNVHGVKYKVTSFPAMVVVGKDGVVSEALPGARDTNAEKLRTALDRLIAVEMGVGK